MSELSGTKELIFDEFVEMTSELGYENVSMRSLAEKVGIKVASIYNHFESKVKILDYAYEYYLRHQYDKRLPIDEMKKLIETASGNELLSIISYTFDIMDTKKNKRMISITKIIYMRLFQDPAANAVFAEINKNNAQYVMDILKHGVDIGRIESDFDLEAFTELLIGIRQVMGINFFSDKINLTDQLHKEGRIKAFFVKLLSSALK